MWYAANLLFKARRNDAADEPGFWEESIRLVNAGSAEEARVKSEQLGRSQRISYKTKDGELTWTFDRVERVHEIEADALVDGVEVFSRFLRDSEVTSLLTPFEDS